jgi:hypothetical protein
MSNESAQLLNGNHHWANVNISPASLAIVLAMSKWIIEVSNEQQQIAIRKAEY